MRMDQMNLVMDERCRTAGGVVFLFVVITKNDNESCKQMQNNLPEAASTMECNFSLERTGLVATGGTSAPAMRKSTRNVADKKTISAYTI